jgi:hypothetical protein
LYLRKIISPSKGALIQALITLTANDGGRWRVLLLLAAHAHCKNSYEKTNLVKFVFSYDFFTKVV